MLEFLALGTIWFWLLLFVVGVFITVLIENEKGFWATLTLVGTILALNYALKLPILKAITIHPWQTVAWVGVYFTAGIVWGLFKWYVFVHKRLALYKTARDRFLKENNATELTPAIAVQLLKALADDWQYKNQSISPEPPAASEHKGDIVRWMSYWPFSIVGTVLNDFVRKAWNHIYTFMAETYDRIAAHVFRRYSGDAALAKQGMLDEQRRKNEEETNQQQSKRRGNSGY